jgi:elongation factor 1-beta
MAKTVVTIRIMPASPEEDLEKIKAEAMKKIKASTGRDDSQVEQKPIAFGLQALDIMFVIEESKGGTEPLEAELRKIKGVNSVEVTDVRRAIG